MTWRIEVREKPGVFDAQGERVRKEICDLGLDTVTSVLVTQVTWVVGDLSELDVQRIGRELLADPVTQEFFYGCSNEPVPKQAPSGARIVEIAYHPGVMDPVEESTLKGIRDLGIGGAVSVHTARRYLLDGQLTDAQTRMITERVLLNKLIQRVVKESIPSDHTGRVSSDLSVQVKEIPLLGLSGKQLMQFSQDGQLFLSLEEMKAIQAHFKQKGRNPTDCELETVAQTWSEHCHHKTFRGDIDFTFTAGGKTVKKQIRNLLKSTIMKATQKLDKPWCVSVFHDNAGIIRFDQEMDVCFKVETHNHPSALEPFGGANTGIGGVIRDILGTGLGARPVCNTDVFCFAPPDTARSSLPAGTLHPKRVMKGVVSGVRDYGNKMGIPTVNGAICFDEHYVGNPLVFCGTVGMIPRGKEHKEARPGDLIVVAGGRTGRDGIHGATFSSGELTEESETVSSGAVQIGDPIQEKKVLDVLMQARDRGLYSAITDCGAGGLSSAVGEMGEKTGARVDLEKVPLKYAGLSYMEIWISESQERMVMAVPPRHRDDLLSLFSSENVEATVIGEFTSTERLELFYHGHQVCGLDMGFMHDGIPKVTKKAVWKTPKAGEPDLEVPASLNDVLLDVLSHHNVCSKEWVIRQYDHEVQGGSIIKPLAGPACDGPSDASVVLPRPGLSRKGLAVSNGINSRYGKLDPFAMACACVDEAVRQIIAVGGSLEMIALLDNFCWGNPDKPDRLGGLVRAAQGCYKAAVGFGTPFISGKDSLYNEYAEGGESIAIPGTILISALGVIDDIRRCVSMDLKQAGNLIYLVGETRDECGGSVYYDTLGELGANVPQVRISQAVKIYQALSAASGKELISSMHDCSEGGLGAALAEMAFSGGLGVTARLDQVLYKGKDKRNDVILFSESPSRLLVEVRPGRRKAFEKCLDGIPFRLIGTVEDSPEFVVYGLDKKPCVNIYLPDLKEAWQKPLRW